MGTGLTLLGTPQAHPSRECAARWAAILASAQSAHACHDQRPRTSHRFCAYLLPLRTGCPLTFRRRFCADKPHRQLLTAP